MNGEEPNSAKKKTATTTTTTTTTRKKNEFLSRKSTQSPASPPHSRTFLQLNHAEQRQHQTGLASTSAATDANLNC
jgi:hypothetical protein